MISHTLKTAKYRTCGVTCTRRHVDTLRFNPVVEPLLIYGSKDNLQKSHTLSQISRKQEEVSETSDVFEDDTFLGEENSDSAAISTESVYPVMNKTRNILENLMAESVANLENSALSLSENFENRETIKKITTPKKYACHLSELLHIFYHAEKILEHQNLAGPDWELQMKKKWHVDINIIPFWVITKSTLEFKNGEFEKAINRLIVLETNLGKSNFFEMPELKTVLSKRIKVLMLLSGVELEDYNQIQKAGTELIKAQNNSKSVIFENPTQKSSPEKRKGRGRQKKQISASSQFDFFNIGDDFINRATFSSILQTMLFKLDANNIDIYDNSILFLLIGSQLFLKVEENQATSLKFDLIYQKIIDSALVEEDLMENENSGETEESNSNRRNFDFIKLLDNVIHLQLLEKIHDTRLAWKDKYSTLKDAYLKVQDGLGNFLLIRYLNEYLLMHCKKLKNFLAKV